MVSMATNQPKIILYGKERCQLCEEAKISLQLLCEAHGLSFEEFDIYSDSVVLERYQLKIPVLTIDGEEISSGYLSYRDTEQALVSYIKNNRTHS